MTKLFDVKGVKGLRKLMKEIAITASTGKHDNELIGTSNIPLKVRNNFNSNNVVRYVVGFTIEPLTTTSIVLNQSVCGSASS